MSLIEEIYERIGSDIGAESKDTSESEIAKFFAGQTLLITGVTGYLGKCLLEKLLRSCPRIKRIYIMIRENEKYTLEQRITRYFQHVIFSKLRERYPDFEKKITVIKGDLMSDNLGLSSEDRNKLVNNVNIIYHNAANVKFDVRASESLKVNVLGTKKMLELAQECKNLKEFMYVSTGYSHPYRKDIHEEFYPSPADLKTVYEVIKADESTKEGFTEKELQSIIGKFPNIYPYSKAIAEDLVKQYSKNAGFAHAIYRPTIVAPSFREPLAGWCGNTNGPVLLFLAAALGFIRVAYNLRYPVDFIPADLSINALLAVTRDAYVRWNENRGEALVYNYGSSTTNPLNFEMIQRFFDNLNPKERSAKSVALSSTTMMTNRLWLFYFWHVLVHFIPSCLIDLGLLLSGRKPVVLSIFWKATKHLDKIHYFGNGNWRIHMPRTLEVIDRMNNTDNEIFYCDIRTICWQYHSWTTWRGLKYYILKEEIISEAGRRRYFLLYFVHYMTRAILALVFIYVLFLLKAAMF